MNQFEICKIYVLFSLITALNYICVAFTQTGLTSKKNFNILWSYMQINILGKVISKLVSTYMSLHEALPTVQIRHIKHTDIYIYILISKLIQVST